MGRLKRRVAEADPDAFVAISVAQEVFGKGFARHVSPEEAQEPKPRSPEAPNAGSTDPVTLVLR